MCRYSAPLGYAWRAESPQLWRSALDQIDYARRMIAAGEGRAQVARLLGVNPSTLRRLLGKG
jgi:hypothetical protein